MHVLGLIILAVLSGISMSENNTKNAIKQAVIDAVNDSKDEIINQQNNSGYFNFTYICNPPYKNACMNKYFGCIMQPNDEPILIIQVQFYLRHTFQTCHYV